MEWIYYHIYNILTQIIIFETVVADTNGDTMNVTIYNAVYGIICDLIYFASGCHRYEPTNHSTTTSIAIISMNNKCCLLKTISIIPAPLYLINCVIITVNLVENVHVLQISINNETILNLAIGFDLTQFTEAIHVLLHVLIILTCNTVIIHVIIMVLVGLTVCNGVSIGMKNSGHSVTTYVFFKEILFTHNKLNINCEKNAIA